MDACHGAGESIGKGPDLDCAADLHKVVVTDTHHFHSIFDSSHIVPEQLSAVLGSDDTAHRKLMCWENFLSAEELEYLQNLVYSATPDDFGSQYVAVDDDDKDEDEIVAGSSLELSDETAKLLAAMGLAPPKPPVDEDRGDLQPKSQSRKIKKMTRNRLRTSSFLRTAWFGAGKGKLLREVLSERAAKVLGLNPTCAEAPQIGMFK